MSRMKVGDVRAQQIKLRFAIIIVDCAVRQALVPMELDFARLRKGLQFFPTLMV